MLWQNQEVNEEKEDIGPRDKKCAFNEDWEEKSYAVYII